MSTEPLVPVYCPVCGQPKARLAQTLYDVPTCRRCIDGFTKRRTVAGFFDWIVLPTLLFMAIGFAQAVLVLRAEDVGGSRVVDIPLRLILLLLPLIAYLLFAAKDGFAGISPGKALCGLRAIHIETGEPLGVVRSVVRNLPPLVVPLLAFVIALQFRKGPRIGDGMGKSRVVWRKYADKAPFAARGRTWQRDSLAPQPASEPSAPGDTNPYRAP
ncbi:MAG: RDD family protein [Pirellulales bacterium]